MRIKVILAGIGSMLIGLLSLPNSLNTLSLCSMLKSEGLHVGAIMGNTCENQNFIVVILGVLIIIGIVLIIAGIRKKLPKPAGSLNQESSS